MILLLLTLLLVFAFVKYVYSYWDRKGFPCLQPSIPFGCLGPLVIKELCFGEVIRNVYMTTRAPFVGIYLLFRPALLIRDPELVKRILMTDFDYFHDRGLQYDEENDPIGAFLLAMPGQKWKDMRAKLTPIFTSGKLKQMLITTEEKKRLLKEYLDKVTKTGSEVKLKTPVEYLIISILASIFFGFELDTFENPDHDFVRMGQLLLDSPTLRNKIVYAGYFLLPDIMKFFKLKFLPAEVSQSALSLMKSVVETRKNDPSTIRDDFIQTIINMMKGDSEDGSDKMSLEQSTAQAFTFYVAGMETTDWLEKVHEEVDALMEKRNGKIHFDDLPDMKVLKMCIKETLRKYPGLPILNRECTKEYSIPGTINVIPKGTPIIISNYGLQMDKEFFPDPDKFDPSRFAKDNTDANLPYYPLSAGPRYCIGKYLISLKKFF